MTNNSSSTVPWLRRTIEVIAIVGSILIAFAIDAWWQGRLEEDEEQQILISLQREFETLGAALLDLEADWIKRGDSMERLLVALQTGEMPAPAVMDTLLDDFSYPGTWDPGSGAANALIASGRLELIENLELRNHLSRWQSRVDEVRDNEQGAREMVLTIINPFLAERVPMDRLLAAARGSWPAPLTPVPEAAAAYRALLADSEFKNYARIRYAWLNLGEYREAIAFADGILMAIDAELEE